MWLPETAVDSATLRVLIDHGIKYVVLAPHQAKRVRRAGDSKWTEVSGSSLDTRHSYRWVDKESKASRSIALFFYDGGLSQSVAFGKIMESSPRAAIRITESFDDESRSAQLVSVATDGETYGHHQISSRKWVWRLFLKFELNARRIQPINYGYYLSKHRPAWEAEIREHVLELFHGIARWKGGCDCGSEGKSTAWRDILRDALDWAARRRRRHRRGGDQPSRPGFLGSARQLHRRPARSLVRERGSILPQAHGHRPDPRRPRRLCCACWSAKSTPCSCTRGRFSHIDGIEAVQNLKYAARAIELAEATGLAEDLEEGFLERLKDDHTVYRRLARPSRLRAAA